MSFFGKLFNKSGKERNKENENPEDRSLDTRHNRTRRSILSRMSRTERHACGGSQDFEGDAACYSSSLAAPRRHPKGAKSCPEEEIDPVDRSFATDFDFGPAPQSQYRGDRRSQISSRPDRRRDDRHRRPPRLTSSDEEADQESASTMELQHLIRKLQSRLGRMEYKARQYRDEVHTLRRMKDEVEFALTRQLEDLRAERDRYKDKCRKLEDDFNRHYQNLPGNQHSTPSQRNRTNFFHPNFGHFPLSFQPDNTPSTSAVDSMNGAGESLTTQSDLSFRNSYKQPSPTHPLLQKSAFDYTAFLPADTQFNPGAPIFPTSITEPMVTPPQPTLDEEMDNLKIFSPRRQFKDFEDIESIRATPANRLNVTGRSNSEVILADDGYSTASTLVNKSLVDTPRRKASSLEMKRS